VKVVVKVAVKAAVKVDAVNVVATVPLDVIAHLAADEAALLQPEAAAVTLHLATRMIAANATMTVVTANVPEPRVMEIESVRVKKSAIGKRTAKAKTIVNVKTSVRKRLPQLMTTSTQQSRREMECRNSGGNGGGAGITLQAPLAPFSLLPCVLHFLSAFSGHSKIVFNSVCFWDGYG
jgi:hypothetical protein